MTPCNRCSRQQTSMLRLILCARSCRLPVTRTFELGSASFVRVGRAPSCRARGVRVAEAGANFPLSEYIALGSDAAQAWARYHEDRTRLTRVQVAEAWSSLYPEQVLLLVHRRLHCLHELSPVLALKLAPQRLHKLASELHPLSSALLSVFCLGQVLLKLLLVLLALGLSSESNSSESRMKSQAVAVLQRLVKLIRDVWWVWRAWHAAV